MRTPTRLYRIDDDRISYVRQLIAKDQTRLYDEIDAAKADDRPHLATDLKRQLEDSIDFTWKIRPLM